MFYMTVCYVLPDNEIRASLDHDLLLVHDVLLLSRLHDVVLLQNLQGIGPAVVVVDLYLRIHNVQV